MNHSLYFFATGETLNNSENSLQAIVDALSNDDQQEIARLIPEHTFFLIDIGSDEDEANALALEVDDYQALAVFLSQTHVQIFVDQGELFEEGEDVNCFCWTGREIFEIIPEGLGILYNPDSDDCFVMDPEVVASFREQIAM